MAENKTQETNLSVKKYIDGIADKQIRLDCNEIIAMMKSIMKCEPKMWGTAIVGFGSYHYVYESGREGDMCVLGFSARKKNISLYLGSACLEEVELLEKLGKHKSSKGCLYINKMKDVDAKILKKLIEISLKERKKYVADMKKKAKK